MALKENNEKASWFLHFLNRRVGIDIEKMKYVGRYGKTDTLFDQYHLFSLV